MDKKERQRLARHKWQSANPEAYQAAKRKWSRRSGYTKDYSARYRLKKRGLSPETYREMLVLQDNRCAICKETFSKTPAIDHSHLTGRVRGLLCTPCNTRLSALEDVRWRMAAEEYLVGKRHAGMARSQLEEYFRELKEKKDT